MPGQARFLPLPDRTLHTMSIQSTSTGLHPASDPWRWPSGLLDPLMAVLVLLTSAWAWTGSPGVADGVLAVLVFALCHPGTVGPQPSLARVLRHVFATWAVVCALLWLFGAATRTLSLFDPRMLLTWALATPLLQATGHLALRASLPRLAARRSPVRAVVVGANAMGRAMARLLRDDRLRQACLLGFFDDRARARLGEALEAPLVGPIGALADFVRAQRVERIYVALPLAAQPRVLGMLEALRDTTASVYFVPDIQMADPIRARVDAIAGMPVVAVCESPFQGASAALKRLSDVTVAAVAIVLTLPLMLAIALAIKLTMPGPVLFRQRRYGLDGEAIEVWKFRSMRVMEDGEVVRQATRGDDRITPLGAFLRRTSLDELPQFFNVLQGHMSVVGPRPHAVAHNEHYRKLIRGYMIRHKVKPGITGWAQVNGARGETDTLDKMQRRIDHDLAYLRHWSLGLDLLILWRTVLQAVRGDENAY